MISTERIIKWMNVVRHERGNRDRLLECFWDSQLLSKDWLCRSVPRLSDGKVVVHGAWYGTLAGMLLDTNSISKIVCVDIDPECARYVDMFNMDSRVSAVTVNMSDYEYTFIPDIVVNTSCEHIDDDTYVKWLENIPESSLIVLQSNNMYKVPDHINCSIDIDDFIEKSLLENITFSGQLELPNGNTRFMIMGYKV